MNVDFFMAFQVDQTGDGQRNRELGNGMDSRETVSDEYEFRRYFRMSLFIKIAFYRLNCNSIFINSL